MYKLSTRFFAWLSVSVLMLTAAPLQAASAPQRLTVEHFAAERARSESPWEVVFQSFGPEYRSEAGTIRMPAREGQPVLNLGFDIDTSQYNTLEVEMRATKRTLSRFNWISNYAPNYAVNSGVSLTVEPSDEFQTYTFELHQHELWHGMAQGLRFFPTWDAPSEVEIRKMAFVYVPQEGPHRETLAQDTNQTCEALFGTQAPWEVTIPAHGLFSTRIGMTERSWRHGPTDGVRFLVILQDDGGDEHILIDETLTPTTSEIDRHWRLLQRDLSAYAGQTVRLRLEVNGLESQVGDFAYWCNPMVFSASQDTGSTPVFLIALDTIRAEHMSLYGFKKDTTPFLKEWAASDAVVFEDATVQDAWTLPAHTTMLTGLYPKHHGVTPERHMAESIDTLPETLRDLGYLSAGFTSISWWLEPYHGFQQGMDFYETPLPFRVGHATNRRAFAWLAQHPTDRVFVFLHNYDAHSKSAKMGYKLPYQSDLVQFRKFSAAIKNPPSLTRTDRNDLDASNLLIAVNRGEVTLSEEEHNYIVALYHDALLAADASVAAFIDLLKTRGLYDKALIVVTADHGEAFHEQEKWMHEDAYQECARVPLVVKFPEGRFAGTRHQEMVQLTDIRPTILDVLGEDLISERDGQSLVRRLTDEIDAPEFAYTRRHAVNVARTQDWKLFHDPSDDSWELYHLAEDPHEKTDLYAENPAPLAALQAEHQRFYAPPADAWEFTLRAADAAIHFDLKASAQAAIRDLRVVERNRVAQKTMADLEQLDNRATAGLTVPAGGVVTLRLELETGDSALSLDVEADAPFASSLDPEGQAAAPKRLLTLDPGRLESTTRDSRDSLNETPGFYVHFDASGEEGVEAQGLTDEQKAELEALGYIL